MVALTNSFPLTDVIRFPVCIVFNSVVLPKRCFPFRFHKKSVHDQTSQTLGKQITVTSLLYVLEIKLKALPEVRAVASFVARLNIISQTLTLPNEETQNIVSAWSFFYPDKVQSRYRKHIFLVTFQFLQSQVCKLLASLQRHPRQSSHQHCSASPDPPGLQLCKTEGRHPENCVGK